MNLTITGLNRHAARYVLRCRPDRVSRHRRLSQSARTRVYKSRMRNAFAENAAGDPEDRGLVSRAQAGNRDALEQLIMRHQGWIYNIVLRMVYLPEDAEDATQEIGIKLITKLSTFAGHSSFAAGSTASSSITY